jgi:hypothetical protein
VDGELQQWMFPQRFVRENLQRGEGGEEGRDNDIVRETFERTGASVMGKRMFDPWPAPSSRFCRKSAKDGPSNRSCKSVRKSRPAEALPRMARSAW